MSVIPVSSIQALDSSLSAFGVDDTIISLVEQMLGHSAATMLLEAVVITSASAAATTTAAVDVDAGGNVTGAAMGVSFPENNKHNIR